MTQRQKYARIIDSFDTVEIDSVLLRRLIYYGGRDTLLLLTDAGIKEIARTLVRQRLLASRVMEAHKAERKSMEEIDMIAVKAIDNLIHRKSVNQEHK